MPRTNRAFTLIELLIVVAIIAILAAIAVPNLLEAQTRAKASRAKSDLRTIATGIESYTVDNGRSPYDGDTGSPHYGWVNSLGQITSPIAYLSTLTPDVFQDTTLPEATRPGQTHFLSPDHRNHSYDYSTAIWENVENDAVVRAAWLRNLGYSPWKTTSAGPDLAFQNEGSWFGTREIYDPTNGTTSLGDMVRSAARTQ